MPSIFDQINLLKNDNNNDTIVLKNDDIVFPYEQEINYLVWKKVKFESEIKIPLIMFHINYKNKYLSTIIDDLYCNLSLSTDEIKTIFSINSIFIKPHMRSYLLLCPPEFMKISYNKSNNISELWCNINSFNICLSEEYMKIIYSIYASTFIKWFFINQRKNNNDLNNISFNKEISTIHCNMKYINVLLLEENSKLLFTINGIFFDSNSNTYSINNTIQINYINTSLITKNNRICVFENGMKNQERYIINYWNNNNNNFLFFQSYKDSSIISNYVHISKITYYHNNEIVKYLKFISYLPESYKVNNKKMIISEFNIIITGIYIQLEENVYIDINKLSIKQNSNELNQIINYMNKNINIAYNDINILHADGILCSINSSNNIEISLSPKNLNSYLYIHPKFILLIIDIINQFNKYKIERNNKRKEKNTKYLKLLVNIPLGKLGIYDINNNILYEGLFTSVILNLSINPFIFDLSLQNMDIFNKIHKKVISTKNKSENLVNVKIILNSKTDILFLIDFNKNANIYLTYDNENVLAKIIDYRYNFIPVNEIAEPQTLIEYKLNIYNLDINLIHTKYNSNIKFDYLYAYGSNYK